jgi:hypothetical protein
LGQHAQLLDQMRFGRDGRDGQLGC